ncbi:MAG: twin-arginine translocation pathway signal protein, partial [Verrucomicrobia bacterium]
MKQTLHTRRQFLRTSALGAAASWTLPVFLEKTFFALDAMAADALTQTATGKDGTILVVLQMAGGNDGLNMVVPYADDVYYRSRPRLGLPADKVLKLDSYVGLNGKLTGLKSLFDEGHLGVVQGVGYPNPNRSHFRSTEIWQTASDADRNVSEGWLGRYFDNCCAGADPTVGIAIGEEMPQAFAAKTPTGITFSQPEEFRWRPSEKTEGRMSAEEFFFRQLNGSTSGQDLAASEGGSISAISGKSKTDLSTIDFLTRTALDAQLSSDKILAVARKYKSRVSYPKGRLAASLSVIACMIAGGLPTRVYYTSQGGFDTHAGQANAHERLMGELNDALTAFAADLKQQG